MPLRVSNSVERNVTSVPQAPIVIPAATSTKIFDSVSSDNVEYSGRYIQNVGANPCYYSIGTDKCSAATFNGVLAGASVVDANGFGSGQQLDCSNVADIISVYSVAGTTIARTLLRRNDMVQGGGGIL